MKLTCRLAIVVFSAGVFGCSSPTGMNQTATERAPRFDSGFGMGSGSVVGGDSGGPAGVTNESVGISVDSDSTARGGFGMGSGS
jgi:hypothetical protein